MTIELAHYGSALSDLVVARDLASKLAASDPPRLNFSGVQQVDVAFLRELLEPVVQARGLRGAREVLDLPSIDEKVRQTVLGTLKELQATAAKPAAPAASTAPTAPKVAAEAEPVPPPSREQKERYTPHKLYERLSDRLKKYLQAAYPLKDAHLIEARRQLLEAPGVISQEPFIETTPRYQSGEPFRKLDLATEQRDWLHSLASENRYLRPDGDALLFDPPYLHQGRALEEFLTKKKDLIVATGTGSGKTECFLLPILSQLHTEARSKPASFSVRAVRALILYPMNALVNDQVSRLRLMFGNSAVGETFSALAGRPAQFAMYTSRTPYPGLRSDEKDKYKLRPLVENFRSGRLSLKERELRAKGRWPAKDLDGYYGRKGQAWKDRLRTQPGDRELLSRHEVQATPPDILVTNYSMLEYMLMRPIERGIFERTRSWLEADDDNEFLLVLDEAHMYRGARGAEVGLLIRRLLARLGLENRLDKVRVICTSASLGSDPEAPTMVRRFCADLTGKTPDDFAFVTGQRQEIPPSDDRTPGLVDCLEALSLADLHDPEISLAQSGAALFTLFGLPGKRPEAELYEKLKSLPEASELLRLTSSEAISLSALAQRLFPGQEKARGATEALLALGTLARPAPHEPGLIPARVHLFFRGLSGLYACINTACPGRTSELPATAGKLFLESRTDCDCCGARVLDLASCRECGATYFLAKVLDPDHPEFLWDYSHQDGHAIELLAEPPTRPEKTEELRVNLQTGYVNLGGEGGGTTRSLWRGRHKVHGPECQFRNCPVCRSLARRPVHDMKTKGEQSFTALIETLFAEQPPQMIFDEKFPNAGRKVLCFSDGRQRAARLAPALEQSHMRDTFRQLLAMGSQRVCQELSKEPTLNRIYFAMLKIIADRRLALSEELHQDSILQNDLSLARDVCLAKLINAKDSRHRAPEYACLLFTEASDRYHSLAPLGLGYFSETTEVALQLSERTLPDVDWSWDILQTWLRIWIRMQLEREAFQPLGVSLYTLYDRGGHPSGIEIAKDGQWIPQKMQALLEEMLFGEDEIQLLRQWLKEEVTRTPLLTSQNNCYYIDEAGLALHVALDERWLKCQRCSKIHRFVLQAMCPDCLGSLHPSGQLDASTLARRAYFKEPLERALQGTGLEPFGLFTAEHSAQLSSSNDPDELSKVEEYELRFQDLLLDDVQPPVDVLSCTTTMEVGIDIGTLSAVALRNVPPHVANYQQRAGRAGRRGRGVAGVVTYAQGGTHDAYFFESPERIISGEIKAPVVYIENVEISKRHARAFVVQTFFHETVSGDASPELFSTLGTIRTFLGKGANTLESLEVWLQRHGQRVRSLLLEWLPRRSHWMQEDIVAETRAEIARDATVSLPDHFRSMLPIDTLARYKQMTVEEKERFDLVLDQPLLQTLVDRAILPRYAFPTDIVGFHIFAPRKPKQPPKYLYQPQRDLRIALSEFAPSAELTVDKHRYQVAALYSPFQSSPAEPLEHQHFYTSCVEKQHGCGFVAVTVERPDLGACPVCDGKIDVQGFLRPLGFAPDVNVKVKVDKGGSTQFTGQATRSRLEVPLEENPSAWREGPVPSLQTQHLPAPLISINRGLQNRGFVMCKLCGRVDLVEGSGYPKGHLHQAGGKKSSSHNDPIHPLKTCPGEINGPFFMGHRFVTDVLAIRASVDDPLGCDTRGPALRSALTTLAETLLLSACRVLQIDEGEMEANWSPVQPALGRCIDLCLYDVLPGGAGFARASQDALSDILTFSAKLLAEDSCTCETSCYRCLRHFGNQFYHALLDRRLGRDFLNYVLHGTVPQLSEKRESWAAERLAQALRLHNFSASTNVSVDVLGKAETVPLVVSAPTGPLWILPIHSLLDVTYPEHPLMEKAMMMAQPIQPIDAYSIEHQLPTAYETIRKLIS